MKKIICIILSIVTVIALAGCSNSGKTEGAKIDIGESKLYSDEDRQTATDIILAEVEGGFEGIKVLYNIRYGGDKASLEEKGYDGCDEVMVFYSDFKTVRSPSKAGGFNTNMKYDDWNWILGKKDGKWQLLTWGY
ncbi:MAG: hypothetical protein IJS03_03435 [Eubacterium sp.]|nr:hypothetical protein [Eubacterium sp.]